MGGTEEIAWISPNHTSRFFLFKTAGAFITMKQRRSPLLDGQFWAIFDAESLPSSVMAKPVENAV